MKCKINMNEQVGTSLKVVYESFVMLRLYLLWEAESAVHNLL